MDDHGVYLEKILAFSRMLRLEGLAVSPQETADGARILTALGMEDRQRVKTALSCIYAKSREEQTTFSRVFDGFFLSEEQMRAQAHKQAREDCQREQARQEAREDLRFAGQDMNMTPEQEEAYASMPPEARLRLREFAHRYKGNLERNPNLYASFIRSVFARAILEQQMLMEDAGVGGEAADPELGLLYRDISQFQDTEIPRAVAMLQTISRQLNGELSARRNRVGHTGKLDFRRTIRKGLETGGSFYRLKYRPKRARKKRLVILCDVSGSMMQFSEFALRLIQSLNQVSESSRVFLFSEDVHEANAFSLQNMDLFRNYVKQSGLYGRGTDLGTALGKLMQEKPPVLGSSTTLILLSDTKTIDQPRAVAAVQEARRQAGRVLWLNPIPESKWPYLRSIQTMASICPMASCSSLRSLAAACRKLSV